MSTTVVKWEQILANARWYYCQDVQLITFFKADGSQHRAAILPASSSLQSVSEQNGNKNILLYIWGATSVEEVLEKTLVRMNSLIGDTYKDGGCHGHFVVNESELPRMVRVPNTLAPTLPAGDNPVIAELQHKVASLEAKLSVLDQASQKNPAAPAAPLAPSADWTTGDLKMLLEKIIVALEKTSSSPITEKLSRGHENRRTEGRHESCDHYQCICMQSTESRESSEYNATKTSSRRHRRRTRPPPPSTSTSDESEDQPWVQHKKSGKAPVPQTPSSERSTTPTASRPTPVTLQQVRDEVSRMLGIVLPTVSDALSQKAPGRKSSGPPTGGGRPGSPFS